MVIFIDDHGLKCTLLCRENEDVKVALFEALEIDEKDKMTVSELLDEKHHEFIFQSHRSIQELEEFVVEDERLYYQRFKRGKGNKYKYAH